MGVFTIHFELGDKTLETPGQLAKETVIRFELGPETRGMIERLATSTDDGSGVGELVRKRRLAGNSRARDGGRPVAVRHARKLASVASASTRRRALGRLPFAFGATPTPPSSFAIPRRPPDFRICEPAF